jgi:hypothetical protein
MAIYQQGSLSTRSPFHGVSGVPRDREEDHLFEGAGERVPRIFFSSGDRSAQTVSRRAGDAMGGVLASGSDEPEEVMARGGSRKGEIKVERRTSGGGSAGRRGRLLEAVRHPRNMSCQPDWSNQCRVSEGVGLKTDLRDSGRDVEEAQASSGGDDPPT